MKRSVLHFSSPDLCYQKRETERETQSTGCTYKKRGERKNNNIEDEEELEDCRDSFNSFSDKDLT